MNCSSHVPSYPTPIFRTNGLSVAASSSLYVPSSSSSSWKRKLNLCTGIKSINSESMLNRVHDVQLYSSRRSNGKTTSCRCWTNAAAEPVMELEKEAFYLVRKGDIVGVYRNFGDCQAQIGSSICDPPVTVYKGYSLPKDTEEHLVSCGLTNAVYTIRAQDLKLDHFGKLMLCPFQEPAPSKGEESVMDTSIKNSHEVSVSENVGFCTLEFDGASKGNPGLAGAGAVLRGDDGSLICKVHEGLGIRTNNVAEYRALILGLKYALKKGFTKIRVQGDSKLVCMQVQGLWKVKNQNMSDLCEEVKELKDKFVSFEISHVLREKNSEADAQANLAVRLTDGEVHEVAGGLDPDQYRRFGFQPSVTRSSVAWWSAIMWFMVMISAAKPAVIGCFCNLGELWSGGTRVGSNNSRYRGRCNLTIMECASLSPRKQEIHYTQELATAEI
ncbi:hypothetical protein M0R45_022648 [Rubus argutus]|uniref:RNase H type-1 domain-containing protein n=1 Tax=Rubus argutus TaxID=59490 RepID=A0AAW1XHP9_RUBAR